MALVGHAGQAARAWQHAKQWNFRQRDGRRTVIDEHDVIAGQRQFITTTGTGTVHGGHKLEAVVLGAVFDAVAGFVGELAEVHLPRVGRHAQHEDVRAGTEDAVLAAGDHHRAHGGVLEADAVQRVVQLHVNAQVIAIELELVAGTNTAVFRNVELHTGGLAVYLEGPMAVLGRLGAVINDGVVVLLLCHLLPLRMKDSA